FREGGIADADVIAPFTFFVPLSEREIEDNRTNAAAKVTPVYKENEEVAGLLPKDLKDFMRNISEIAERDTVLPEKRLSMIRDVAPGLKRDPVELLLEKGLRDRILAKGLELQEDFLKRGIINDASPLRRGNYVRITVITENKERQVPLRSLIEQGELETIILGKAKEIFGRDEKSIKLFYSVLRSHLMPNFIYNMEETKRRRDGAEKAVMKSFKVSENQRIIAKHDKVTKKQVDMLEALEKRRMELEIETSYGKRIMLFFSKALRITVLLFLLGLALYRLQRELIREPEKLTLIFIILAFYLFLTALVIKMPFLDPYLVPIAFVSLVSAAFFGIMTSVMFTLFASLMLVTHTDLPANYMFTGILAGTAAIVSIAQLRERKNFYT
ncbi:MAG: hypothetical protein KAX38_05300, partial [Candidatus Krumholzibacteria bacterium]|nr:hypothetical protein [Candidatus Krumholzibacteria bacterium]